MPFIPVANTLQIRVTQSVAGVTAPVNNYHIKYDAPPGLTQGLADGIAEALENLYESSTLNAHLSTAWSITEILVTDLTSAGAPQFAGAFDPIAGTDAADLLPTQDAALINWITATRGRSFRGKTYHAGFSEAQSNGSPTAALLTALESFASGLQSTFTVVGQELAVVSRFSGSALTPGPGGQVLLRPSPRVAGVATPITSHHIDRQWHTQRRRGQRG